MAIRSPDELVAHASDHPAPTSPARADASPPLLEHAVSVSTLSIGQIKSLLESLPNAVALLDTGGRIIEANRTMARLLAPGTGDDITDDFMSWVNACLPDQGTLQLSYWTEPVHLSCTLSEVEHHYLFSMAPVISNDGYVVIGTDISHQVKVERQLQRAKELAEAHAQARAAFLANMSHEIRTPLHGILGSTELLLGALSRADQVDAETHARIIHSCGQHLLALVNDILDFSRIDSNNIVLESRAFDVWELIQECMTSVQYSYRKDSVRAILRVPDTLPRYVRGDSMRVRQVVLNLLGNAFKFTEKGMVELGLEILGQSAEEVALRVVVSDTGIGIAQGELDKLFAPFEQADTSITRRFGGTGLGLAIASHLVDLMGGQIGVESVLGQGSTFWFTVTLPLAAEEIAPPGPPRHMRTSTDSAIADVITILRGARILLVEDNVVSQRIAAMMLEQVGCQVTVAGHGAEALDRLAEAQFDIILMDCQMPVMDGLNATRELRRRERGRRTPVIALTADAFESHKSTCLEAGMDGYLRKPVRKASLCRTIAEYLLR